MDLNLKLSIMAFIITFVSQKTLRGMDIKSSFFLITLGGCILIGYAMSIISFLKWIYFL